MAKETSGRAPLSPAVIAVVLLVVVGILGFWGWKSFGAGATPERVTIDVNKVKQQFQESGFGRH